MNNALLNGEVRVTTTKIVDSVVSGQLHVDSVVKREGLYSVAQTNGSVLDAATASLLRSRILTMHARIDGMVVARIHPDQARIAYYLRNQDEAASITSLFQLSEEDRQARINELKNNKALLACLTTDPAAFWKQDTKIHDSLAAGMPKENDIVATSDTIRVFWAQNPTPVFNSERVLKRYEALAEGIASGNEARAKAIFEVNPYTQKT